MSASGLTLDLDPVVPAPLVGARWCVVILAMIPLWAMVYPLNLQSSASGVWLGGGYESRIDLVSNLLLFAPLGLVAAIAARHRGRSAIRTVIVIALAVGVLSLACETAQLWLPKRDSSRLDLLTNTGGAVLGALAGCVIARRAVVTWSALGAWLAPRAWWRRALIVLMLIFAVKTAPFDVSLDRQYLISRDRRVDLSAPMPDARRWLVHGGDARAATLELLRAASNVAMFAILSAALVVATCQSSAVMNRRASMAGAMAIALLLGGLLVVALELSQWPVRSRWVDLTDPATAAVGMLLGAVLGLIPASKAVSGST